MINRMGRPGLIGTMARTAVISGTATAVGNSVNRRQQQKWQGQNQAQQQAAYEAQQKEAQMVSMQAQLDQLNAQAEYDQRLAAAQAQAAARAAPAAAPAGGGDDLLAQIQKLGELKAAGILSDEEFTAAKARLIG